MTMLGVLLASLTVLLLLLAAWSGPVAGTAVLLTLAMVSMLSWEHFGRWRRQLRHGQHLPPRNRKA